MLPPIRRALAMAPTSCALIKGGTVAAPVTSSFTVTGALNQPSACSSADLRAFPAQMTPATRQTGQDAVSANIAHGLSGTRSDADAIFGLGGCVPDQALISCRRVGGRIEG